MTRSPSFTARFTTRPIVSALMFTDRLGSIVPDADTTASRLRFCTFSALTTVALERRYFRLTKASAPSTTSTPMTMKTFLRVTTTSLPSKSGRPRCRAQ